MIDQDGEMIDCDVKQHSLPCFMHSYLAVGTTTPCLLYVVTEVGHHEDDSICSGSICDTTPAALISAPMSTHVHDVPTH